MVMLSTYSLYVKLLYLLAYAIIPEMSYIPSFPEFARLSLTHKDLLRATAKRFPPYSDFNFVSMYTWNTDETMSVAILYDNLIVRLNYYEDDRLFLSMLGTNRLRETIETLFAYCRKNNMEAKLELVPQSVVSAIPERLKGDYEIVEDRDNHDYIVSVKNVCEGGIARNKRRSYKRFLRSYDQKVTCKTIDLTDSEIKGQVEEVITTWTSQKILSAENEKEFKAIERCLKHVEDLDIKGYGAYVDGRLVAFLIFESASESTAILHYGKSNRGIPGAFDFIKIELARHLAAHGIEFMNFEQDVGVEGLRLDKSAFYPVDFLKKYIITQRS
jgi:uncharacterized protein